MRTLKTILALGVIAVILYYFVTWTAKSIHRDCANKCGGPQQTQCIEKCAQDAADEILWISIIASG